MKTISYETIQRWRNKNARSMRVINSGRGKIRKRKSLFLKVIKRLNKIGKFTSVRLKLLAGLNSNER